jgi:hypothetical protein
MNSTYVWKEVVMAYLRQANYVSISIQDFKYYPDTFLEALRKPVIYVYLSE